MCYLFAYLPKICIEQHLKQIQFYQNEFWFFKQFSSLTGEKLIMTVFGVLNFSDQGKYLILTKESYFARETIFHTVQRLMLSKGAKRNNILPYHSNSAILLG